MNFIWYWNITSPSTPRCQDVHMLSWGLFVILGWVSAFCFMVECGVILIRVINRVKVWKIKRYEPLLELEQVTVCFVIFQYIISEHVIHGIGVIRQLHKPVKHRH